MIAMDCEPNPTLVCARFLLLFYSQGNSSAYYYNGLALAGSFFVTRVVTISLLLLHVAAAWYFY